VYLAGCCLAYHYLSRAVRIPVGLPACAANASKQAGGGQEQGCVPMATPRRSYPSPGRMELERRIAPRF